MISCISTDPENVHNSSTDIVDKIYNCLCPYVASKTVINIACR